MLTFPRKLSLLAGFVLALLLAWLPTAAGALLPPGDIGEFVAFCDYSHMSSDDPIVYPGQVGRAHSHDFFGSTVTDAHSTIESLLAGGTTCDPVFDRSAYWIPTLYDAQGQPIRVEHATFYYTVDLTDPTQLQSFPLGFKVIAGLASAQSAAENPHFKWSCLASDISSTEDFVVCPEGSKLELLLDFPDCWDGQNLDSANHRSHAAYSVNGSCPASHPVAIPILQFKLRYEQRGEPGMTLSSGPAYTAHGDFFNAWEPRPLENRVNCLRMLVKCGPEGLGEIFLPMLR